MHVHPRRRPAVRTAIGSLVLGLVTACLAALGLASASPAAAASCSLASTGGTVTRTVWVDWTQGFRSYNLHVPSGLAGNSPLLLDMHGISSAPFAEEMGSGWSTYADSAKFIVAYPGGTASAWAVNEGSPDVTFIRAVVADIRATWCVDAKRIFANGSSLGGFMTQRLACDAEDLFASGVSYISGNYDYFGGTCSLSRPVSMGIVNGEDDQLFTADQSIKARDGWLALDHCSTTGTPDANAYGLNGVEYGGCDGGVDVLWRTYTGVAHGFPTGAALDDWHTRLWSFLMAHPHP